MKHIAILDFGSQYTHLIARNIREIGVLSKIYPHDVSAEKLRSEGATGIIISGGPQSVYDENSITIDAKILELEVPVLGLCYGHQLIAHLLGGKVEPGKTKEYGRANLEIVEKIALFSDLENQTEVWMSHGDSVMELPTDFVLAGKTDDCPITAMADEKRKFYGLQFHPEVDHTRDGQKMIRHFVFDVCQMEKNWAMENILLDLEEKIREKAGSKKVFMLVSGGVDSNVAFALLTKTLGEDKVLGLYIDTGFMRLNESEEILENFKKIGMENLHSVDASKTFFEKLKEVYEPEEKRKIIGQTFLDVKDEAVKNLGLNEDDWMLGQGTIYPDIIESGGTKNADKIKTHHNRVDAVQKLIEKGLVIEPLADFYKYEVRQIGRLLELPDELVDRHPFPGPGLAIRVLNFDQTAEISGIEEASKKIEKFYEQKFSEINSALLPIKSVGVQGDNRTYAHPLAVWGETDWQKLDYLSVSTTNSVPEVNRVILLLNPKEKNDFLLPKESLYLTKNRVDILRTIDEIVNRHVKKSGLYDSILQFPIVLTPITDQSKKESIVLRPINSRDFMTLDFYRMEKDVLEEIVSEIENTGLVSHIFYDITNKPPGTTEWE